MQLLASWKQSLGIFYPLNNLKLFSFAVLRAVHVAVPQFFKTFWWLLGVSLVSDYFGLPADLIITPLLMACIYLVVRPSVGIKNVDYWKNHGRYILGGVLCGLALALASLVVSEGENFVLGDSFSSMGAFTWGLIIFDVLVLTLVFALLSLWFFFFLDSRGTIRDFFVSFKRAFLMAAYAFPVWLIILVVHEWFFGLLEMVGVVESWWSLIILTLISICMQIVVACVWSVFYTKRLHEQFELYFPGPQIKE